MPNSEIRRSGGAFDGLSIRWGRVAVLALGGAALVLALITALLAAIALVGWPWPVFLLLLGAGCLAALRYLAVQDQSATPTASVRGTETDAVVERERSLFDHEQLVARDSEQRETRQRFDLDLPGDQEFLDDVVFDDQQVDDQREPVRPMPDQRPEPRPEPAVAHRDALTREELLAEARRVARRSAAAHPGGGGTWQPVPVPKPIYTRAAVAHRESPEALQVPVVPAPTPQTLQQAARAPQARPETPIESRPETQPARIDLDDVLSRRRA